jgi:hypothetical protein
VDPRVAITIGVRRDALEQLFAEVEEAAVYRCAYCTRWRDQVAIHVARGPRVRLADVWPRFKHFE